MSPRKDVKINLCRFYVMEPDGKWKVSTFRQTPVMSSYLVAIFVSEFDFDESYTKRGVRFRLWSPPKDKPLRKYGLETAVIFMETFEKYFGIEDVVMKQDIPLEISESYDSLSYSKGGIIIAMIRDVVGEQNFRKALIHYLKKFSFENTRGNDLWKAFDEAVEGVEGPDGGKLSMVDFGPQWSKQIGQERYMKVPHAAELQKYRNSAYGYKWDVPLWYQWDDKQVYYKWLKREEPLYLDRKEAPIVINVDKRGYFIQNYDSDGWKKITRQFEKNHEVYSPHTRYTIISDAFSAALIGQLDYETVFALLKYLSKEE
ncbi:hypothetical protein NECAME_15024, partial [Necator americanus]